ncbi:hypothetical protein HYH02_008591 [Chlamydomonas schloesseri]|uniref:Uncharacterized protein n=1 Tax=Chlamydomonas schloesseri TaxID=2026947 RepID=A0A835WFT5_9CHLO|nr:hypothetical protein HYH02_008591 [Chlamydomonas schloesseri]|eukprot:KAG2446606.1 hypothetical protein HYH02_008591 [Chlamydomonas schloesseri]
MKVITVLSAAVALVLLLHSASAFHPYRNRLSPLSSLEDDTGMPASSILHPSSASLEIHGRLLASTTGDAAASHSAAASNAGRAAVERRLAASRPPSSRRPPPGQRKKKTINACMYFNNSQEYDNGNFTEARNCIQNVDAAPYLLDTIGKTGSAWAKAFLLDAVTTTNCFKHSNGTKEGLNACRADRKNRCYVSNGGCGNDYLDYVVYGGSGNGGAACKGSPNTEYHRCQSLFKDECTAERGCAWNMIWNYGTYANYAQYEPTQERINNGPTEFGACISLQAQEAMIANYKSSNMSEQYVNNTAVDLWTAPNGPNNDLGNCTYAQALRKARAYRSSCIDSNTVLANPEVSPFLKGVAVENGTIDMNAAVQCVANGCTILPLTAAYKRGLYGGVDVNTGHFECVYTEGTYQSYLLDRFTDGEVFTMVTECNQVYRHSSQELCEAVKIQV